MRKEYQLNLRVTKKELSYIRSQAKLRGGNVSKFVLDCIYNKQPTKYIQETEPVEYESLRPPPEPPSIIPKIEVITEPVQPRGVIQKTRFLTEIRQVFKEKGIFIN